MSYIDQLQSGSVQIGDAPIPPVSSIDIWPSLDPTKPFSAQNWGVSNFVGAHQQIGVHQGVGAHLLNGLTSLIGFKTAVGGEVKAQQKSINSASVISLSSPLGSLNGFFTYNGSNICAPCPSDESAKINIKPLESSLEKVLRLQGVSFGWNSEVVPQRAKSQESSIGLIAQEVEKIIPEVVVEELIEDNKLKTIEYGNLTGLLVEAIKEQQDQISELKETVQELSNRLANHQS
jgi:hypothetical protein